MLAGHRLLVPGKRRLSLSYLTRESHDCAVGLELRERRFQDLSRPGLAEQVDQVDGHVVRGPETGVQRVRAARSESGDGLRVQALCPLHDGVAFHVDTPTPRAASELRVLPRRDRHTSFAVE